MVELDFMLTRQCNAACPICFTNSTCNSPTALSKQDILSFLNGIYSQDRDVEVHFTGGEPCCFPSFYELLSELDSTGIGYQFVTNGTLLEVSRLHKLRHLTKIVFSLYGCQEYHNQFVGVHNAFQKVKHSVIEASTLGINIQVNITCFDNNIYEVRQLLSDELFNHVSTIKLYPVLAKGRADQNHISITESHYLQLVSDVKENAFLRNKIRFHSEAPSTSSGCLNNHSLFIDEYGNIYPCLPLSSSSCTFANIKNSTLSVLELIELSNKYRCTGLRQCKKSLSS